MYPPPPHESIDESLLQEILHTHPRIRELGRKICKHRPSTLTNSNGLIETRAHYAQPRVLDAYTPDAFRFNDTMPHYRFTRFQRYTYASRVTYASASRYPRGGEVNCQKISPPWDSTGIGYNLDSARAYVEYLYCLCLSQCSFVRRCTRRFVRWRKGGTCSRAGDRGDRCISHRASLTRTLVRRTGRRKR